MTNTRNLEIGPDTTLDDLIEMQVDRSPVTVPTWLYTEMLLSCTAWELDHGVNPAEDEDDWYGQAWAELWAQTSESVVSRTIARLPMKADREAVLFRFHGVIERLILAAASELDSDAPSD